MMTRLEKRIHEQVVYSVIAKIEKLNQEQVFSVIRKIEQLSQEQVSRSVVPKIGGATDQIAEEMAREILQDPVFRQHINLLIRRAFEATLARLDTQTGEE